MRHPPLLVGITGSMGAGKSAIAKVFALLGVPTYEADAWAKHLLNTDKSLRQQVSLTFGKCSYIGGKLNRPFIAREAFAHPEKLAMLNTLVHPHVRQHFHQWVKEQKNAPWVLKEAALLLDAGVPRDLDFYILVSAPKKTRIERIRKRDPHRSVADILLIMARQTNPQNLLKRADIVIKNDNKTLLLPKIFALHEEFTNRAQAVS